MSSIRYRIRLAGQVQGVGFRPYIKRLADQMGLSGTVANTTDGVTIEIEGERDACDVFVSAIRKGGPPAAVLTSFELSRICEGSNRDGFHIASSVEAGSRSTILPPDLAICADCLREMRDASDPRFRYAFINCTNCGPRFSIATGVPYDRSKTTMTPFVMCSRCDRQYHSPEDRRFHAEPIACPECGPALFIASPNGKNRVDSEDPLRQAILQIEGGGIVAVRGIGGFQLVCDALNVGAVERLRERKQRSRKPFAVMMRDIETVLEFCAATEDERQLLFSSAAPIVLLKTRQPASWDHIAPGLKEMGVMLPYSPLHQLLFEGMLRVLVMTSGNVSDEPIAGTNEDALSKLGNIADLFLCHNREIVMRVDDSVVRHASGSPRILRRSRGYTPAPVELPFKVADLLACGADLKAALCLASNGHAVISQHLGDMENLETFQFFEESLANLKTIYRIQPRALAHDLHPDYMTTRWAERQSLPRIAVQHHHAHFASCMAENGLNERVIGVTFDGTGYGTDGQVWGGEFLVGDYRGFERAAHIRYVPLIGGEQAIRQPWRMAAAYLIDAFGAEWREQRATALERRRRAGLAGVRSIIGAGSNIHFQLRKAIRCRRSVDRCCYENSYEGEAAMLLEASANPEGPAEPLHWHVDTATAPWTIDLRPTVREIVRRIGIGDRTSSISRDFHETVADIVVVVASKLRDETGVNAICLSGGTFQNALLLERFD